LEQELEPPVRVLGPAEPREHAHRPKAPAIHGRIDAARERVLARKPEPLRVPPARQVRRRVDALDGKAGHRLEGPLAFGQPRVRMSFLAHPTDLPGRALVITGPPTATGQRPAAGSGKCPRRSG